MNTTYNLQEVNKLAQAILKEYAGQAVFIFEGNLGAGKTTLIKAMCLELGVINTVSSPTYNIVNEYDGEKKMVYHMDLYRLKNEGELFDIGIESYLNTPNTFLFVEWGDLLLPFLDSYVLVKLTTDEPDNRICSIELLSKVP